MKSFYIYFILGLLIITIKIKFSYAILDGEDPGVFDHVQSLPMCSKLKPPSDKCRKQVLYLVQRDGKTITGEKPSPECCSEFRRWGDYCYSSWLGFDNVEDYQVFGVSEEMLINANNIWVACLYNTLL